MSDSPGEAAALARSAAEALRRLNHLTLGGESLSQAADACEVLGELSLAASRIPQLLGQVGRHLAAALAAGRLGCDGNDPVAAVSGAWLFMSGARTSAGALARDLASAQQQLAAVSGPAAEETEGEF